MVFSHVLELVQHKRSNLMDGRKGANDFAIVPNKGEEGRDFGGDNKCTFSIDKRMKAKDFLANFGWGAAGFQQEVDHRLVSRQTESKHVFPTRKGYLVIAGENCMAGCR
jgi:hypothetical protein